jgi:hypothetical protein
LARKPRAHLWLIRRGLFRSGRPSGKLVVARQVQGLPTIDKPVDVDPALVAALERFRKGMKKE